MDTGNDDAVTARGPQAITLPDMASKTQARSEPAASRPTGREALLAATMEVLARDGIGNISLRQIAAEVGTSHRMLLYHFQSREGLLVAVVEEMDRRNSDALAALTAGATGTDLRDVAWMFWKHAADNASTFGPLFFELSSQAMLGRSQTEALRDSNFRLWHDALTQLWVAYGLDKRSARKRARLNLAVSRGLLHDLLLTGDRRAVDAAMREFVDLTVVGWVER